MPKSKFVDFKAIKAAISMEQVLSHYCLIDRFKKSGDTLSGPCPIHKGDNPTQFRVSTSKNLWNCFSECKHGGNVLDFIARMENIPIHSAAMKAIEWFNLDADAMEAASDEAETEGEKRKPAPTNGAVTKATPRQPGVSREKDNGAPNAPLKFRLDNVDPKHPYLAERGLTPETIAEFGLGFCAKGIMAERIVIPINNVRGELVAYAGRFPGEPSKDAPKYKLPPGFRKGQELFNLDRALKDPEDTPLVIVEGFFGAIKLWQNGYCNVVALMGSSMSAAQAKLIYDHIRPGSSIIVMLDEDEAGRAGRGDIASRLCRFCFVRVHEFSAEGTQPEHLTREDVVAILGGPKKLYQGVRDGATAVVTVDGQPLNPRLDLWNHSPSGFDWGYDGAGPAQLALAILADCLGDDEEALARHNDFDCVVVSGLPHGGWVLTEEEIRNMI